MTGARADEIWPLVRDHHYSGRMAGLIRHAFAWRKDGGLFGDFGDPVAAITYSEPVSQNIASDALELSRLVRAPGFDGKLSAFVTWSLRWLRGHATAPFVISYADTTHGHHGGIYQACGFAYIGATSPGCIGFKAPDGTFIHGRACNLRFGTRSVEKIAAIKPAWVPVYGEAKYAYVFPLRQKLPTVLRRNGWQSLPYPKPAASPSDAPVPAGVSEAQPLVAAPAMDA